MKELWKQLGLLVIVVVAIALVLIFFGGAPSLGSNGNGALPPPTPPTQQDLQQLLSDPPTFQYLVSYTNNGFVPAALTVKKGETVRFADNSSQPLWVASVGENENDYPGTSSCGGTTFDSCQPFEHGNYWELTFTQTGTWTYQNNADTAKKGTITVQ